MPEVQGVGSLSGCELAGFAALDKSETETGRWSNFVGSFPFQFPRSCFNAIPTPNFQERDTWSSVPYANGGPPFPAMPGSKGHDLGSDGLDNLFLPTP